MVVSPVVNQRTPAYDASVAGDGDSGHGSLVTARRRPGAKAGPGTGSIHLLCRYVVTGPRRARRVWNKGSLRCMAKERRKFMLCVMWSSCPGPAAGLHLEFPQPPIAWTDRDPRGGEAECHGSAPITKWQRLRQLLVPGQQVPPAPAPPAPVVPIISRSDDRCGRSRIGTPYLRLTRLCLLSKLMLRPMMIMKGALVVSSALSYSRMLMNSVCASVSFHPGPIQRPDDVAGRLMFTLCWLEEPRSCGNIAVE